MPVSSEQVDIVLRELLWKPTAANRTHMRKALDTAFAASPLMPVPGWQPIATGPTDGTSVLVWDSDFQYVASVWWHEDGVPVWFNGDVRVYATHWMPLPAAPALPTPPEDA